MAVINSGNHFDVIIIGAGISGLVCASYLTKAGMKVLLIEQHTKPGGYCTSFKRKEFLFDAGAHSFGSYRKGGHLRKILTELGIDSIIRIRRYDPSDIIVSPDFTITFHNDLTKTISDLSQNFPAEKDHILKFFNFVTSDDQLEIVKYKNKAFSDLLSYYFNDKRLINALATPALGNGGLPPSLLSAFTGAKIFTEFLVDGGYYPEDCMQALPNAFEMLIKQQRGVIIYKKRVNKILHDGNHVTGIEVDNSDLYYSKYIVSACDCTQTFKSLLAGNSIGEEFHHKISDMTPSLSSFILYIGIDKPFKELPPAGSNLWYLPSYDLDKIFDAIKRCNFNEAGGYMLRVSPDNKTILAFCLAPYVSDAYWINNKKTVAMDFLDRVIKFIPNLKKHIVYFDSASPKTLYRYTLNYQGANYGWAPTQSQFFDPDFKQKTALKGFYLTGHWITRTAGIPGVAYLGYNAAKLILQSMKKTINLT